MTLEIIKNDAIEESNFFETLKHPDVVNGIQLSLCEIRGLTDDADCFDFLNTYSVPIRDILNKARNTELGTKVIELSNREINLKDIDVDSARLFRETARIIDDELKKIDFSKQLKAA